MGQTTTKTYNEAMIEIVDRWEASGGKWPAPTDEIARFAIRHKLWEPPKRSIVKQCARDLSRAMREVYFTDPQGRAVRALHAARYSEEDQFGRKIQRLLWADSRDPDTTREHMENAFQLRRRQIVGDCWQLKIDADSFNENHPSVSPIQLIFNFENDLDELGQPEVYDPTLGDNELSPLD